MAPTLYNLLMGSLMYLVNTQTDICFAFNQLSQFMVEPTRVHWVAAKHVLRYLRGIMVYGLWYKQIDGVRLEGFTDVDWEGGSIDRKSTSSCTFSVGSTTISWFNKNQRSVALRSTKVEYMVISLAACEAI